jgi:hypothetical protein
VSATIGGLASGTVYHFRLVASNSGGTTAGVDHTFKTKALPPSSPTFVTLGANVNPVKYGHLVLLSGVVTSRAAGEVVTLQQKPYPYNTPFKQVGNSVLTDATGKFSLTVAPLLNTQYRAVARKAGTNVFSPVILERVRISVTTQLSDTTPRKGQRVRFHGSARPPHAGAVVRVQRRTSAGGYVTIAKAHLHAFSTTRSTYSLHARIRMSGYYRVRVSTPDSDHVSGIGTRRHLRVH